MIIRLISYNYASAAEADKIIFQFHQANTFKIEIEE